MKMPELKNTALIAAAAAGTFAVSCTRSNTIQYPAAPSDSTVYQVSGITVADPFRPLENDTSAATAAWVQAENAVTRAYLDSIPFHNSLKNRLTVLNRYGRSGAPEKQPDGKIYYSANDGTTNQDIVYRINAEGDEPEIFINPNTLSDDGTVALTGLSFSPDGRYAAYTISRSGSDWTEIFVLDTATGELLPDHIEWAKFTGAEWRDNGFYYSAYPRPAQGQEYSVANENHKVYFHRLGTSQAEDAVVYENPAEPLHFHTAQVVGDGRYLIISASGDGHGNTIEIKDMQKPADGFVTAEPTQQWETQPIGASNGKIYAVTAAGAPRNRLVAIDPARPERDNWQTVIGEDPEGGVLAQVVMCGPERFIAVFDRDASHHAVEYTREGAKVRDITFPTYGTAVFSGSEKNREAYYTFSSFTAPTEVYKYDSASGLSIPWFQSAIDGFNPDDYVTEQIFFNSADGTRVPMFMVRHQDTVADGTNPVYLYGYGGFNVPLNPRFSANRLLWLENGGIYVSVNLRGGSEYGENWHNAGTKMNKQNVFDDFIAAAEHLIATGWTKPELLAIEGGSNGGLLVGAVVNQRPDLFKVAIPRVGVMDMMRYHLFTIGWNWAHDYGTSEESPEMAAYLLAYSPIHNIHNDGTPYPAILVTTADHDDRVVPAHSFKYAATLQSSNTGDAPKLIRIDSNAGHGAGKPTAKIVDEFADIYSFIYYNMGIDPTKR